jgi:hypothetical protein
MSSLLCCAGCVEQLLSSSLCPTCRAPLRLKNNDKVEGVRGVGGAETTFELPVAKKAPADKKQPAAAAAAVAAVAVASVASLASPDGRGERALGGAGRGRGSGRVRGHGGRGGS